MPGEEVLSIVSEEDRERRPKRKRVLRAADVIPPFDEDVASDESQAEEPPGGEAPASATERRKAGEVERGDQEKADAGAGTVPSYDLAENILAEQRRVAGKRRRAPGPVDEPPASTEGGSRTEAASLEPSSQDLAELQQIVAEIVARDIERLSSRSSRQACVQSQAE